MRWWLFLALCAAPGVGAQAAPRALDQVVVTAPTPLSPEPARAKAGAVVTLQPRPVAGASAVLEALEAGAPGVSLSDASGNGYQRNLVYRGFQASPLQGAGQGLAVYVDGARFNQPFGDTVNWDLIPDAAVAAVTLEGANPLFGLNALGGSVSLRLKTGFVDPGGRAEVAGGDFGRMQASLAWGGARDGASLFLAGAADGERGWRDFSAERLRRLYADVGVRRGGWESHAGLVLADNHLAGEGPAPVELLAADRSAVFTHPDLTHNRFGLVTLRAEGPVGEGMTVQASAYAGRLAQDTANGDATDAAPCEDDPGGLCLEADGPELTDESGRAIADFLAGGPYAQLNSTRTRSWSGGLAANVVRQGNLLGRAHGLTLGASVDLGRTEFAAQSALGALTADRGFGGPGVVIDQAEGPISPVALNARNLYAGFYVADALAVTPRLTLDISARYNAAQVSLRDERGSALNGRHGFGRINPAAGLVWRASEAFSAYLGYAEANRTPTPAELSCASPEAPCSLTNFFVADPDLKQAVARTWEAGLRGRREAADGLSVGWSFGVFRADTAQDITLVMSAVRGRAFFQNIGQTRRQGVEAALTLARGSWRLHANYALTDARARTPLVLNSPDNPAADAEGRMFVEPGDRLAGAPRQRANLGLRYAPGPFSLGLDLRAASSQVLFGDEANLQPRLPGYVVCDLNGAVRLSHRAELFMRIRNVGNVRYASFGTFAQTSAVALAEAPGASDPRSVTPGEPRSVLVGLSARF